jgi:hypothetical protein
VRQHNSRDDTDPGARIAMASDENAEAFSQNAEGEFEVLRTRNSHSRAVRERPKDISRTNSVGCRRLPDNFRFSS